MLDEDQFLVSCPAEPLMGSIINAAILSPSVSRASLKSSITPNAATLPEGKVDPTCGTKGANANIHQQRNLILRGKTDRDSSYSPTKQLTV